MSLPAFPFSDMSLESFATAFRTGQIRSRDVTQAILTRIDALQPRLAAYAYIDHEGALARATAVDAMRSAGVDLGPLMGLPIALKDLFSVRGMPMKAGSRVDVSDLVPPQGPFVTALGRAGCVVLGKTTTTEFAMGGINLTHRLPWNPCDPEIARMTGGSSHGSAVAMAAGMAAMTFGSDTGGSVRWPAALCGIVGYKASPDHWPVEGVFPLSKNMDSLGVFTNSAADAAFVEAAMRGQDGTRSRPVDQLALGVPTEHFFDNIDRDVRGCFDEAVARLTRLLHARAGGDAIRRQARARWQRGRSRNRGAESRQARRLIAKQGARPSFEDFCIPGTFRLIEITVAFLVSRTKPAQTKRPADPACHSCLPRQNVELVGMM